MTLSKCGFYGTSHDTVEEAIRCCDERFNDDPDEGAGAAVAMTDGGRRTEDAGRVDPFDLAGSSDLSPAGAFQVVAPLATTIHL